MPEHSFHLTVVLQELESPVLADALFSDRPWLWGGQRVEVCGLGRAPGGAEVRACSPAVK
jgi:hypothetical protein